MVVANGVTLLPADLTARAVGTDDALDNTLHQLRYLLAYLLIMSTHRSGQAGAVRNHVIAVTGLEGRDGQHRGVNRVEITRHYVLQRGDNFSADYHRVDAELRH